MKVIKYKNVSGIALCVLCACFMLHCGRASNMDLSAKNSIDSLNHLAFDLRYRDVESSKAAAEHALKQIEDLLPDYYDAKAQAWNHIAYASFLTSRFDSTRYYLNKVRSIDSDYRNRPIEEAITYITEARLYLRECKYAEAFIIYDSTITIFKNRLSRLRYSGHLSLCNYDSERYNWARSDYLIGNAVMDYYYRGIQLPVVLRSLHEIERNPDLHIDTTQLSILYYTLIGSYASAIPGDVENLLLSLEYLEKGFDLQAAPVSRIDYQLANLYQITAEIMLDPGTAKWLAGRDSIRINSELDRLKNEYLVEKYQWSEQEVNASSLPLMLLQKADSLYSLYDNPYQKTTSSFRIGQYYLKQGDTVGALDYFSQAIGYDSISTARGGSAVMWTNRLYRTLLINAPEQTPVQQIQQWFGIYREQQAIINENTISDYNSQRGRSEAEAFARRSLIFAGFLLVVFAIVSVLLYYLYKRNKQLHFVQNKLIEQKRMELLTYVVRGISHELSQPLGSITQTLYDTFRDVGILSKGKQKLSDEQYNEIVHNINLDLHTIASSKERISELTNSFRNMIRENMIDPEMEFNVHDKLEDIVNVLRPNIKSNIDLRIDCPPQLVVRSFPLLFSQIMTNLISNADQHAFPDSDSPQDRIRIVCRESGRDLVVKCIDNGTGIPEHELEKLCQPFVSKKRSNLGLGLALVKNIVEQYIGGSITFYSDGGLTVTVRIPDCIIKK